MAAYDSHFYIGHVKELLIPILAVAATLVVIGFVYSNYVEEKTPGLGRFERMQTPNVAPAR